MDTLQNLRNELEACKGTGQWADIAKQADCNYFTVARLYRGALTNPSLALVERLFKAIKTTSKPKKG